MRCPQCGIIDHVQFIGDHGNVRYYRCISCGWGWGIWKDDEEAASDTTHPPEQGSRPVKH